MPGVNSEPKKLEGYDFYCQVLGSPKYVVAPMVDQSELLVYTPMINAKACMRYAGPHNILLNHHYQMFAEGARKGYRDQNFNITLGEEGGPEDRPLIVQFCANSPEQLLKSAKVVEPYCDAVDVNLGCPQDIARRGHYGSFLQDEWDLIYELINTLHRNLSIPVTAKFRVFPTVEKTVEYAKMLERAGAQILTCHGRLREQRGHNTGLADWEKIRAVKEAVSIPVFANGNVLFHSDIERCLAATGADAIMSAEGNLYNPAIFSLAPSLADASTSTSTSTSASASSSAPYLTGLHPRHTHLALEYLAIVQAQRTPTSPSAVKGHLFKLLRPALARAPDLRERLGRVRAEKGEPPRAAFVRYADVVRELDARLQEDVRAAGERGLEELVVWDAAAALPLLPHWLAQPYFRPLQPDPAEGAQAKGKQKAQGDSLSAAAADGEAAPGAADTAADAEDVLFAASNAPDGAPQRLDAQVAGAGAKRASGARTPDPDDPVGAEDAKRTKLDGAADGAIVAG
ncbi:hypothetical protein POSPLADRAFT_1042129 [Postia placenta MAD-698-R-SB12]|uniref:tRNA-dihydrouridine(16/17) synthase [NAD(P)(+)] n=1 Tax=Postia placenta MAD-698-R-SB12 TaxID=670580 RepID=A0A1X6NDU4_9APHY|nr:hypothetical protein POSPLADRAFT_1042129 [Postia placenta MAD-698-R-SB12]OSX66817.1 hypothetical protein POSPLADRAFT_1042129 [Postia placenta MAD-698-R-SB12]